MKAVKVSWIVLLGAIAVVIWATVVFSTFRRLPPPVYRSVYFDDTQPITLLNFDHLDSWVLQGRAVSHELILAPGDARYRATLSLITGMRYLCQGGGIDFDEWPADLLHFSSSTPYPVLIQRIDGQARVLMIFFDTDTCVLDEGQRSTPLVAAPSDAPAGMAHYARRVVDCAWPLDSTGPGAEKGSGTGTGAGKEGADHSTKETPGNRVN